MGYGQVFENMIEEKLLDMNTAYLAKVISTDGKTAKIQPLGNVKAYGENAKKQSPLSNVPIIQSARYKMAMKERSFVKDVSISTTKSYDYLTSATADTVKETVNVIIPTAISKGDVVIVVCCDRDISEAKKGINSTPVIGHHSMSDSVIVGIL